MNTPSELREHGKTLSVIIYLGDLAIVLGGLLLAYWLYLDRWPMPEHYLEALVSSVAVTLLVFPMFRIHQLWWRVNLIEEWWRVGLAWVVVVVTLVVLSGAIKVTADYSRVWMGLWTIFSGVGLITFHATIRAGLVWLNRRQWRHRRVLIVGAGEPGRRLLEHLRAVTWTGIRPVGLLDDDAELQNQKVAGIPVIGPIREVERFIDQSGAQEVWLALPLAQQSQIKSILHELRNRTIAVRYVPDITDFRLINHSVTNVAGLTVLNLTESPMNSLINRCLKEVEDRILASVILLVVSPLMLVIALGVKLSSPGPVLYRQERISWNGTPFRMLKFRSMPVGAESNGGPVWATESDPRPTRTGSFLRKTSLDELPQFINVLKGEMSIVGPRPERPVFVEKFKNEIPGYMKKHLVKAGITGWAQVNGWRGNTDLKKRIEYDLYYIEHWSIWLDFKIILLTIFKGIAHKNAY